MRAMRQLTYANVVATLALFLALGGGVSRSLCLDNYGKALSAAILGFEIDVPDELRPLLRGAHLLAA